MGGNHVRSYMGKHAAASNRREAKLREKFAKRQREKAKRKDSKR